MDTQQRLIISLKGLLQTGEKLLANLDNSQLAFEYLENSNKIGKYILETFYHNSILRQYYKDLPKVNPDMSRKVGDSILEKIVNSRKKTKSMIELFGIIISPEKEKQRDELMLLVSDINQKTRTVLQQLNSIN